MRLIHWLFLVSAALFISGIGFIIAGRAPPDGGTERRLPRRPCRPCHREATHGRHTCPSPRLSVFDSVGTIVDATGIHEKQPSTDDEWAAVGASAAALVESANLLLVGDRAIDQGDWAKFVEGARGFGECWRSRRRRRRTRTAFSPRARRLNESCDNCHDAISASKTRRRMTQTRMQ